MRRKYLCWAHRDCRWALTRFDSISVIQELSSYLSYERVFKWTSWPHCTKTVTDTKWLNVFFSFFFLFVGCLSVSVCARSHKKWVFCFPLSPPVTHYLGAAWIRVRTAYIKIRHETSSSYEHSVRQLFQMWINKSGNFNLDLLLRAFRSDADQEWKKPGLDPFSLCLLLIESYRW